MVETGLSFKRFRAFSTVCSIAFPILVTITLLHQNSISYLVKGFPKSGITQNATTNVSKEEAQNVTAQAMRRQGQNLTVGPKYESFADTEDDYSSFPTRVVGDKFLDGLLASTFDEGSCLSRHQSYLYSKPSPHKPSSYLKSKLRDYEHLHRSCGSYYTFIRNNTKSGIKDAAIKCRYLIWTAVDGLGNRMLSLASAFLYAILTDRVFLVKFETDMDGLFCEPFPNSSWLLPRDFPHWEDQKHKESFLVLDLQHTNSDHYNFFHCAPTQDLLRKVPVLILQANQYFVPSLFMIPSFRQDLSKMFPEKDTIFHHLGHYLFHPSNGAWEFINNFYQAHLAMANQRIGLQIRVFDKYGESHQVVFNKILACTFKHNLLPQVDMQIPLTSPLKNHSSKAILVTSLYSEYGKKLRTMYMSNTSVTKEVIRVYQPSHEEHQNSNDNKHNIKAWAEIYLLSLCDVLITSSESTFGYVAQSLGGLKSWILQRAYGEKVSNPPCERAMSMEPCFHYPPKRDCSANAIVNVSSLFPHTRHCEDFGRGVKLISDNS